MTTSEATYAAALLTGVAGAVAGFGLPPRWRRAAAGFLTAAAGALAVVAAAVVLSGRAAVTAGVDGVLPLSASGFLVRLDPLAAFFVLTVGVVAVAVGVYAIGYTAGTGSGRTLQGGLALFVVSMLLVPAAASVTSLLVVWELMALISTVLVGAEHRHRAAARSATQWYAVMTHLGFLAILVALAVFASRAGGESFADLRAAGNHLGGGPRGAIFLLALVGFGSKAGAVPLHVWLPRAHPEAPSHVSALMSGAMVNLGIYGVVRVAVDLLGGGPAWWGVVVVAMGAVSALFGILHALVSPDLKRLLAYSTTENVGLILIAIGASLLLASTGNEVLAGVALAAGLLHTLNHAVFKALLFLAAGSVLRATGVRDLDRLGGLMRRMPVTGATFAIGALAIAALPPLNGFTSEWLLLQSLVHGVSSDDTVLTVTMPLAVAAVALTGGLAAATFVKALGTGFLALPRSEEAAAAHESPVTMGMGLGFLAASCVVLGAAPTMLGAGLGRVLDTVGMSSGGDPIRLDGWNVSVRGIAGSMSPVLLLTWLCVGMVLVLAALRVVGAAWQRRVAENWGCGRAGQTPRMEYTATSFAEPLQRVFDDVLHPVLDVDVDHRAESRYYVDAVRFRGEIRDGIEQGLYRPVTTAVSWWGRVARRLQNGSVHRYLAYGFIALIILLVVAR